MDARFKEEKQAWEAKEEAWKKEKVDLLAQLEAANHRLADVAKALHHCLCRDSSSFSHSHKLQPLASLDRNRLSPLPAVPAPDRSPPPSPSLFNFVRDTVYSGTHILLNDLLAFGCCTCNIMSFDLSRIREQHFVGTHTGWSIGAALRRYSPFHYR
jgi:hypothetical protein